MRGEFAVTFVVESDELIPVVKSVGSTEEGKKVGWCDSPGYLQTGSYRIRTA